MVKYVPDDRTLQQQIADELFWDSRVDESRIEIHVQDRTVRLTGTVPTAAGRYRAEADARHVPGVITVVNQLQVDPSAPPPETELLSDVRNTLFWSPDVDATQLDVVLSGSAIVLRGSVPLLCQKARAAALAASVHGVRAVVDEIRVVPAAPLDDARIQARLQEIIQRQLPAEAARIQVQVQQGKVLLTGVLPSRVMADWIERQAEHLPGVIAVVNQLER